MGNDFENSYASGVVAREGDVVVRVMRDDEHDYRLLTRWLSDHRVLKWYEGRDNVFSLDDVKTKFGPRALAEERVRPCIIELDGPNETSEPVGYIQYYPVDDPADYELDDATDTWGFDLFLGQPRYWGSGAGTKALAALVRHVFEREGAVRCVIDPRVVNERGIRSYEKVGFKRVKVMQAREMHEGAKRDNWLMVLERDDYLGRVQAGT